MPRIYPTTPRLVDGQFPNSHELNREVRGCLDTANALDSKNFQTNTIEVNKVQTGSFTDFFKLSAARGTAAYDDAFVSVDDDIHSTSATLVFRDDATSVGDGLVRGVVNVEFYAPIAEWEESAWIYHPSSFLSSGSGQYEEEIDPSATPTSNAQYSNKSWKDSGIGLAPARTHAPVGFYVLLNGHKAGESEFLTLGVEGATAIPFHYLHDGGDIAVEVYAICAQNAQDPEDHAIVQLDIYDVQVNAVVRRR